MKNNVPDNGMVYYDSGLHNEKILMMKTNCYTYVRKVQNLEKNPFILHYLLSSL